MYELALVGVWHGVLAVGGGQLLLIFNFIYVNSYIKGYLDVPVQSVSKLPFGEIYTENDYVAFNITTLNEKYTGHFNRDYSEVDGIYEQNGYKFNLVLFKVSNFSEYSVNRPQTPVRPFSYIEEEVKFTNPDANVTFAGTLTYPNNTKPIALVVLAHGSDGQDRDETMYEHKPFMVIADHLTKHNIAVLRYDERGIAKSTGNYYTASDVDFADDLLSAIVYAERHPRLSCVTKIGVIGHSKGAVTSLIAKRMSKAIKFIVLLGAPALPGEESLHLETRRILEASGFSQSYIDIVEEVNHDIYDLLKAEPNNEKFEKKVIDFYDNLIENSNSDDKLLYTNLKAITLGQMEAITTAWFRSYLVFDPRVILSQTTLPILGLWGTNDLIAPANENLNAMKTGLESANNKQFDLRILTGLNHLFQNSTTGHPEEFEKIEETFSVEALNIINDWIQKTVNNA